MYKTASVLAALLLLSGMAYAAGLGFGLEKKAQGGNGKGQGSDNESESPGQGKGLGPVHAVEALEASLLEANGSEASIQARLRVIEKLKLRIREKQSNVSRETNNNRDKTKEFRNQNVVRERVMSLLALRNLTEDQGIGQQVAEVAREFSNSVNKTQGAEERINNRGWVSRTLFGGDDEAADEIESEVSGNKARINRLKQLRNGIGEGATEFLDEQIGELDTEQNRLQGLAQRELKSKGIFGWIYK